MFLFKTLQCLLTINRVKNLFINNWLRLNTNNYLATQCITSMKLAFNSIQYIMQDVLNGWFIYG
jgi:quinol-cytochrome oxidoreductase complex cytochrome b subunit